MEKKMLFIYHANAGKGKIKEKLSDVMEIFNRGGYEVTVYATQAPKEATQLVLEKGADYDVVACSGGDGTINEVINGLVQFENPPLCGYLPMGTVNDFASSLAIPKDPIEAAQVIVDGNEYLCDIGSMNGSCFNYFAGFGAFTEVSYETPQDLKNSIGKMAYFIDAIRRITTLRGYNVTVECDDGKEISGTYIFGMICNSKSVGGFSLESENSHLHLDDGVIEVVLIRNPSNPMELERVLNALTRRDFESPFIDAAHVKSARITCDEELHWTLDGEDGGYCKEATVSCLRRAIKICSPKVNRVLKDE